MEQQQEQSFAPRAAMSWSGWIATAVLALAFLIAITILTREQNGGPPHTDVDLAGNEPATIYMPGTPGALYASVPLSPKPVAERPPGVVVVHGYTADRVVMGRLARRFALNGYVALAIDLHGHGENRNPFESNFLGNDTLIDDIKAAVDFLRGSGLVDPSRIVVLGHSMGAGAALDYAMRDTKLSGAVMISGGFDLFGPARPRNALFIFGEHDPSFLRTLSLALVSQLAGTGQPELGKLYGDFDKGDAVEAFEVPGANHLEILVVDSAARKVIEWADSATGVHRTGEIKLADPRRATSGIALLLFLVLMIPLGRIVGAFAPGWTRAASSRDGWIGLAWLAVALIVAMPISMSVPASVLSLDNANEVFSWLGIAGVLLMIAIALREPLELRRTVSGSARTLGAALLGFAIIYAITLPISVTLHRLTFTPERFAMALLATVIVLPFWLGFELLIRRGSLTMSTLASIAGRVLLLVLLFAGIGLSALPTVLGLIGALFVLMFIAYEIFAASVYSTSANLAAIALVESAWTAWILCAWMPIRFSF
ncbi:MAG TPA: alpha/beta fold hydrolase [Candidatus Binataceae bacterium]|nr:alpha/beta fold hydrolase [Candidatus Binataceae bacterium]